MVIQDISKMKSRDKILCKCDNCGINFSRRLVTLKFLRKRRNSNKDYCKSCACKLSPKPQQSPNWWTPEKRKSHGQKMRASEKFLEAMRHLNQSGEKNGMYHKKHTVETKLKMSISRTGKKQSQETIRKRIETTKKRHPVKVSSINVLVKTILHKKFNWYKRIYERDGFKCTSCGTNKIKLDAHHAIPLNTLIKSHNSEMENMSNDEKVQYLTSCIDIIDAHLNNGITLCRDCHKKIHNKWGSHDAK